MKRKGGVRGNQNNFEETERVICVRNFMLGKSHLNISAWYVYIYIYIYIYIITGVQASGVIIDRLLRQCCFVWSEIVGPHSSGNFNDWPLKLKAGSKYRDALRDSI